jgi:hypothetical protein
MRAFLDITIAKCPRCKNFLAESSWYALESDIGCGFCGRTFNMQKTMKDRVLIRVELNKEGKIEKIAVEQKLA